MNSKDNFVFVVCGADEHIKTLNFSIKYLRKFSKNNIIVITDKQRNNVEIEHDNVFDIKTPDHFDNHQASIYLKTGLYQFIDLIDNYCYLDSDVIALTPKVDEIFNQFCAPVTFAADHCWLDSFSPNAVNCGCSERKNLDQKAFIDIVKKLIPEYEHNAYYHHENGRELYRILGEINKSTFKKIKLNILNFFIKYILNQKDTGAKLGKKFRYSRSKKGWVDMDGNLIMHNLSPFSKKINENSEFLFNKKKEIWVDKNDEEFFSVKCDHLAEKIRQKFCINITKKDFQHWNGGVFLFNKESIDFLKTWHMFTLEIFKDKDWKTRDQGTLVATAWKYNLQNQKLLPREFNFIADYFSPLVTYNVNKGFTYDNYKTIIDPKFIHVYHQFGNKDWDIWQGIEKTLGIT